MAHTDLVMGFNPDRMLHVKVPAIRNYLRRARYNSSLLS